MILPLARGREPLTFAHHRDPGQRERFSLHLNNYYEIYVFVSGEAGFVVEDDYYELLPGDVVVIHPHAVHRAVLKSAAFYERFYLLVPVDAFAAYPADPLVKLGRRRPLIRLSAAEKKALLAELYAVSKEPPRGEADEMSRAFALLSFLCRLAERADGAAGTAPATGRNLPDPVRRALKVIHDRSDALSSVAEIADAAGVTPSYLSELFRKAVGTTPGAYLKARRIGRAKKLLEEGRDVTFVCYECGFNDCSYFIRCFKESVGMTPYRYRKTFAR